MPTDRDNDIRISDDRLKIVVDVWKHVVSVQMHFNEIEMKIRNLYFTIIAAAVGLVGVSHGKTLFITENISISITIFIVLAITPISYLFYFVDRFWYHRLLQGAVNQAILIETKFGHLLPEIQLGSSISKQSPVTVSKMWKCILFFVKDKRFKEHSTLHSDAKIEVLYKTFAILSFISAVLWSITGGVQIEKCNFISYIFACENEIPLPQAISDTYPLLNIK